MKETVHYLDPFEIYAPNFDCDIDSGSDNPAATDKMKTYNEAEKCHKTNVNIVTLYLSHYIIQPMTRATQDVPELIILSRCAREKHREVHNTPRCLGNRGVY